MTDTLHPRLLAQLQRLGLPAGAAAGLHPALADLLRQVSQTYRESDRAGEPGCDRAAHREGSGKSNEPGAHGNESALREQLKASQARLASLVSMSSDWVWEQDTDLRFSYVSDHMASSGLDLPPLLLGRCLTTDMTPATAADAAIHELHVAARGAFRNITWRTELEDGQALFIRISGEPVFDDGDFRGWRGVGADVTQAMQAEQRAVQLARYDSLTGLPNRSLMMGQLEQALRQSRERGAGLALIVVDIDRFKTVNDSLGHGAGDELLKIVAQRLTGLLRAGDVVARLGGDEFVVMVSGVVDPATLSKVAGRILDALGEPMRLAERPVQVSASVGVALHPADADDAATLLKCADTAMTLAKSRGKNNFQFFTAQMGHNATRHFALEAELRLALLRDEFRLHYQPRYNVADGSMCGMEALIRWQHPQRGLLAPGEFIELAEESGLIVAIGRWVVQQACRQVRAWRQAGLVPPRCSINLSVRQFGNDAVVDEVSEALAAADLEPQALEVEITESLLMADPERAQRFLIRLHEMGVSIAIDDFGTGYSSLAYLKRFPAQTLKIDRSFIKGLPGDRDDAAITQAVIAMAHSLGMQVVAEGVETREQLAFLRDLTCDEVQGYLLARPLAPHSLGELLQAAAVDVIR